MPAKPRWLLAIPDAISQLEQLDRPLLTRRGVARAMYPWGEERNGGASVECVVR